MTRRIVVTALAVLLSGCAGGSYVRTSDGVDIAYEYRSAENARGTALLIHGLGSDYGEWYTLGKFLRKNGWSTLALDMRGHGDSLNWKGQKIEWKRFSAEAFRTVLKDIDAVRSVLPKGKPLWLVGSSFGSNVALVYAAQNPDISGLVLLSAGLNLVHFNALTALNLYGQRPVLFAASEDDSGFADFSRQLYEAALGPKKLFVFEEAGHGSSMVEFEKPLKEEILLWLNQSKV